MTRDPQQAPAPNARLAATWRRYLRFWGPHHDADVDDELQFHLDMRARDYMARGIPEPDARAAAASRLGDVALVRAECIAVDQRRAHRAERARTLDALAQDVRYAVRTLGRQRGWTAVAVLTLALGIGANTAVFSIVDNVLLHPLPYPNADRVVVIYQEPAAGNHTGMNVLITPRMELVRAWRQSAHSFEDIEPVVSDDRMLEPRTGTPALVHTASILPAFPAFAGQRPLVGRAFVERDAAQHDVVLLGENTWRQRYGSDARIVGQTIRLDDKLYTVVGVMPADLRLPELRTGVIDVWLPLSLDDKVRAMMPIGRLAVGAERGAAQKELDAISAHVDASTHQQMRFTTKLASPSQFVSFRDSLILLWAAVGLVLLIACANVAHLQLARAAVRQRELAIRAAIGARGARLFRQLLTESLVLSLAGCAAGLLVGWIGLRVLVGLRPHELAELAIAHVNAATLAVTIALALVAGVASGVMGALQATRGATHDALKTGASSSTQGRRQGRLRSVLVVSEMALSTTLLVAASLLVRSIAHLQALDPGFAPRGLYAVDVALPQSRYATLTASGAFFTELVDRARHLPGVQAATLAASAPPGHAFMVGALQVEGQETPPAGAMSFVSFNAIQPDYFRLMGIRIVRGSPITDTSTAAAQVVVNEGFARKYWPGTSPVGKRLRVVYNGTGDWLTIVGVAADASTGGPRDDATSPMIYTAGSPSKWFSWSVILRLTSDDAVPALRTLASSIDPRVPPPTITSIERALHDSLSGVRFTMLLLASFTMVAVLLAGIGLYGVMTYAVAQRTREIGIRIALGASLRGVARGVVTQGIVLAIVGVVVGLAGALWATRLLDKLLYGMSRLDPVSFVAGTTVLLLAALLACVVPTRRATAVDPLIAMRAD